MASSFNIPISDFKECLSYCPDTGIFRWKKRVANSVQVGSVAGGMDKEGYRRIFFRGRFYMSHRIAFAIYSGRWPCGEVDHINGNRSDNRWTNLREVSHAVNARNQKRQSRIGNRTTGVRFRKKTQKWTAQIMFEGLYRHLGTFENQEQAIAARKSAENEFGFHANHGR